MSEAAGPSTATTRLGDVRPADAAQNTIVDRIAPVWSRPYLRIARLDRPIGWWLLVLPCWWSSALASLHAGWAWPPPGHLILFLIGAVAMRGAGSVWNDVVDRDLDGRVERTRGRPLPSGTISVRNAVVFGSLLSLIGLMVLLSFNRFAILVGLASLLPVVIYPFMKRVTNHPQVVLGLAFAWGALMGWAAAFGSLAAPALLLYVGAVIWVVAYDTIYALQDIEDDAIVGIGSTARAYGRHAVTFVAICYLLTVLLFVAALWTAGAKGAAWVGLAAFALHLARQVSRIDPADGALALRLFHSNRDAGLLLLAGLLLDPVVAAFV